MMTRRLALIVTAVLLSATGAFARRPPEGITGDWENLGVQAQRSRIFSREVGRSTTGDEVYYLGMNGFALALEPRTGRPAGPRGQFDFGEEWIWDICAHSNGKAYATCGLRGVFEFDAATGEQRQIGTPPEGETVIWELYEASDGHIYGGTYPSAKLVRVNLETDQIEDLGRIDPEQMYVRTIAVEGDYVYCGCGVTRPSVWAYHIPTGEKTQILPDEAREGPGWGRAMTRIDDRVYIWGNGEGGWRVSGLELERVEELPHLRYEELADGTRLYAWDNAGPDREYIVAPRGGEQYTVSFDYETEGPELWDIFSGPDGRIYGNTHTPITLFANDPETCETQVYGDPVGHAGQVYASTWIEGKLHMAAYSDCSYTVWDPAREWSFGTEPESNPRRLGDTRPHVQRAGDLIAAPDGRHTLVCGIPGYGHQAGGIAVVDPEAQTFEQHDDVVAPQSPWSLSDTPDPDVIAIGTTMYSGTGTEKVVTLARVVLWNWRTGEVLSEFTPWQDELDPADFVKLDDEVQVNSFLRLGDQLWMIGAPDGRVAVYDFGTEELTHLPYLDYGSGRLLYRPEDGMIYSNMAGWIVRIDPRTHEQTLLASYPGSQGCALSGEWLYAFEGARLLRLRIG